MDVATTPLLPKPKPLTRSPAALIAGAGFATVSLATVGGLASIWRDDGYLPLYAAQVVCGAGLCVSLLRLQTVQDKRRQIAHAQTLPAPRLSLLPDQQTLNKAAAEMTGFGVVLGAASVGLAATGAALNVPTATSVAAASVGLFNLATAAMHFYNQIHPGSQLAANDQPAAATPVLAAAPAAASSEV